MKKPSFVECICRLQLTYLQGAEKYYKNSDFWYIVDHLSNDDLITWANRLTKTRILQGKDFVRTCNILFEYPKHGWTMTQKRSIAMDIIKNWDDLSFRYEL